MSTPEEQVHKSTYVLDAEMARLRCQSSGLSDGLKGARLIVVLPTP
jgi:hypothetical protein